MAHLLHTRKVYNSLPAVFNVQFQMKIEWFHLIYSASSTVGTRQIILTFYDEGGAEVIDLHPRVTQIHDEVIHYEFIYGAVNETSKASDHVSVCLPYIWVEPGWTISVSDEAAIDLAGDTVIFSFEGTSD